MAKREQIVSIDNNPWGDEEAHFYHTIANFDDLVAEYSIDEILKEVNADTYMALFNFFVPELENWNED